MTRAKDSILAAVSYPFFKLKWVPRAEKDSSTTSTDGNSSTCTDLETLQYLRDEDTSLNILNTYPIKKSFTIQHLSPEFGTSGTAVFVWWYDNASTQTQRLILF
ncbi:hypothetical protein EVAR_98034_1 [Eumeta japonica]|uniref:Uncharacterized protein n=1 Tax=Eumeta variegata TaxID=151549 RepID=A0A4C1ZYC3_EUMVA|nr:hypothetical protein EVAR_98034_1 [Eumeta japonica]